MFNFTFKAPDLYPDKARCDISLTDPKSMH